MSVLRQKGKLTSVCFLCELPLPLLWWPASLELLPDVACPFVCSEVFPPSASASFRAFSALQDRAFS